MKHRWLKPGVDFGKYNRLMIDSVIFCYAPDSEDKGIDGEQMKELTDAFNVDLINTLKGSYPIVSEPGPDVARLKTASTGIKRSRPMVAAIFSVIPVGIGISIIKKGGTSVYAPGLHSFRRFICAATRALCV